MVFADTSFWVALGNQRDRWHEVARNLWKERPRSVVTSNHVTGETWTLLYRRCGHRAATLAASIRHSAAVRVEHVSADLESDAWRWLEERDERVYSFVDATSFALMRKRGLTSVYAFDGDFSAAGFIEVRP